VASSIPNVLLLRCVVQHYSWGGYDFIPALSRRDNPARAPWAELWLGAHPSAPALALVEGRERPLDQLIAQSPPAWLGERVARRYDHRLPFLFKVLDVRQMLSIQAHPSKAQAQAGFQRENALGIPLDAPHRLFKDDNHKPELMVALSPFWLLHGFRSPSDIAESLRGIPEFFPLLAPLQGDDIAALYHHIMTMPQIEVNRLLGPVRSRLSQLFHAGHLDEDKPAYWAAQAFEDFPGADGNLDRGIFSIFLLNLVRLAPMQGIFQGPGIPHAYLRGVNVELMANSDNVFRGGLTPKYVDVDALIDHLDFNPIFPVVLDGVAVSALEWEYPAPAADFLLSRIQLEPGQVYAPALVDGPEILLLMEGEIALGASEAARTLRRGDACFVAPGAPYTLTANSPALLFRARVGE
jgi:mannose-6-phosphate isomerase